MPKETKSGSVKIEFALAESLKKKLQAKCKKQNISVSQVLRDQVQGYLKK